jgi:hypothetical protein
VLCNPRAHMADGAPDHRGGVPFFSVPAAVAQAMGGMQGRGGGGPTEEDKARMAAMLHEAPDVTDGSGLLRCAQHLRQVCLVCHADHRLGNAVKVSGADRLPEAEFAAFTAEVADAGAADMGRFHAWAVEVKGLSRLKLGNAFAQAQYDEYSGGKWRACAACGSTGVPLKNCKACKVACYCSVECQKEGWPQHKGRCAQARAEIASGDAYTRPVAAGQ